MSDNKIMDNLQFDDDIDFDGLDEIDESDEFITESELLSEDIPEVIAEEVENCIESDEDDTEEMTEISESDCSSENEAFEIDLEDTETEAVNPRIVDNEKTYPSTDRFVRRISVINVIASVLILGVLGFGIYAGGKYISAIEAEIDSKNQEIADLKDKNSALEADYIAAMNTIEEDTAGDAEGFPETEIERGKILFYDSSVGYAWIPVISGIKQNTYDMDNFSVDDRYRMSYTVDGEESSYFGIDVSSYQKDIDWQLVKEDGVEFAFLRIGYRGYGAEGKLCADEYFVQNYEAAHDAGIDLGVYFFSQATSVAEAVEEAEFVLSLLENRTLEYPIVFDWENIYTGDPEDIPRTDDMMPQTLTLSAIAFCEAVKDAGYEAMIYTNKKLATIKYDLRQLSDYPVWLAYYDTDLDYYYDFDIWQYGTAQVDGIEGEVDVNIAIIK